jgi:hypothetical protein
VDALGLGIAPKVLPPFRFHLVRYGHDGVSVQERHTLNVAIHNLAIVVWGEVKDCAVAKLEIPLLRRHRLHGGQPEGRTLLTCHSDGKGSVICDSLWSIVDGDTRVVDKVGGWRELHLGDETIYALATIVRSALEQHEAAVAGVLA